MNFSELKEQTIGFLDKISEQRKTRSPFWGFYIQLRDAHGQYFKEAKKKNLSPGQFQGIHNSFVSKVEGIVQSTDLGQIFVSLNEYRKLIKEASASAPLIKWGAEDLDDKLEHLWKQLNGIMRAPNNFSVIVAVLENCEQIEAKFNYFDNCERFLKDTSSLLLKDIETEGNLEILDIGFSTKISTLSNLSSSLDYIQRIYSESCHLLDVNESEYPLTVLKIETGSLWSRLIGESKVVEFMTWFLKEGLKFLHRRFTIEGKLHQIPKNIETLEKQLNFYTKLKEIIPEEDHKRLLEDQKEAIAKSAALIAKNGQKLLEKETKLRIGSEVIDISDDDIVQLRISVNKDLPDYGTEDSTVDD